MNINLIKPLRVLFSFIYKFIISEALKPPASIYKGKTVLVLGPAETLESDLQSISQISFDLVVRMNSSVDHSIRLPGHNLEHPFYCDILYSNMKTGSPRDPTNVNASVLRTKRVTVLIRTIHTALNVLSSIKHFFEFRFNLGSQKFYLLPVLFRQRILFNCNEYSPTTGIMAIAHILSCSPRSVFISGFTFFQTKYHASYNDMINSAEDASMWAKDRDIHHPEADKLFLKQLLHQYSDIEINLSSSTSYFLYQVSL